MKYVVEDITGTHAGRPPHGGRGLKYSGDDIFAYAAPSPSPRRAWIEIDKDILEAYNAGVALPTEGVD